MFSKTGLGETTGGSSTRQGFRPRAKSSRIEPFEAEANNPEQRNLPLEAGTPATTPAPRTQASTLSTEGQGSGSRKVLRKKPAQPADGAALVED
jgi:hypothetical protein